MLIKMIFWRICNGNVIEFCTHDPGYLCLPFNIYIWTPTLVGAQVAEWVRSLDLTTRTSLSPIRLGFAPSFVNYKKWCTRLAAASDKVYQLLAQGRWFSPGTPASSTTKTGRHDIAEILLEVAFNTKIHSFIPTLVSILEDLDQLLSQLQGIRRTFHISWFINSSDVKGRRAFNYFLFPF